MAVTIQKWGNSHAVRLPKAVMEQAGLCAGTSVEVSAEGHTIRIRPSRVSRRIPIRELVKGMTPGKNRYPEFDDGPVGQELI